MGSDSCNREMCRFLLFFFNLYECVCVCACARVRDGNKFSKTEKLAALELWVIELKTPLLPALGIL